VAVNIAYPPELPISEHAAEIQALLGTHQVVVVAGETGSGKTTQLPKICLAAGLGRRGMIAHTQPRRLAARAVANRLAEELGVSVGGAVGYAVRFSERVGDDTLVKLVTDGLLLTEIRRDRYLQRYEVIILDEAHERSLNVDFLLGFLRRLLQRRNDLKLIITSATIDVGAFSKHFSDAPVVEVGGRGYPVETRYLETEDQPADAAIIQCIEEIATTPGRRSARDILLFQSGEREILETARSLRQAFSEQFEILPLYARLSARDQARVFRSGSRPRIVLATNVAETSLTVPNIGFVIDPGYARVSRYSYRSKLQRLPIEPISQASANQRQGRCGRIAPGICYRLYSEQDFQGRPEFTDPEIKRTNLAQVVLQMRSLGLGDVARFPFLDPPDPRAVRDAERLLTELGALKAGAPQRGGGLTRIGRDMARLPVDPRLARMLLAAQQERCVREVLIIVCVMAIQDPRERPLEKRGSADRAHSQFLDPRSDFLGYVRLWNWYLEKRAELGSAQLRKALASTFLSATRMREWHALHRQLLLSVRELGMTLNAEPAHFASVHRALLTGSLSFIGLHDERGEYQGPRNMRFRIFPGSGLASARPQWLMAGEISETQRVYARSVARIEPKWIEEIAGDLAKRQYAEPHWSVRRGEVVAYESVTLYGLRLVERRRVSYRRIDPGVCRELFLNDGLVRGGISVKLDFLEHNQALIAEILQEEAKGRRRDMLLADSAQADLYDRLIPAAVVSAVQLKRWWRRLGPTDRTQLFFTREQLTAQDQAAVSEDDYPGAIQIRELTLRVRYRFAPGEVDDGVSVDVPVGVLGSLIGELLEWSVPGFFPTLVEHWLRTLPKQKRRPLAPIPDRMDDILAILMRPDRYRQGRLLPALAGVLKDLYRLDVSAADWDRQRVPQHLLVNLRVIGDADELLAQGRDVASLKEQFAAHVEQQIAQPAASDFEAIGLREFPPAGLPPALHLDLDSGQLIAYPGLLDEGQSVAIKLFSEPAAQRAANRSGYPRLALLAVPQTVRVLKKELHKHVQLGLQYASLGDAAGLTDEVLRAAAWRCFFSGRDLPATAPEFAQRIADKRGELADAFSEVLAALQQILAKRFAIITQADELKSPAFAPAVADVREHLRVLVPADVLTVTPTEHLLDLPRFLDAMTYRLAHLQGKVGRDRESTLLIGSMLERLRRIGDQPEANDSETTALRFELEELRVALFAQPMSRGRISAKRLDKAMAQTERALGLI
jgi:ATP-dependent helicase HrpA